MFWLVAITTVACMALSIVMVLRGTRNAQVMDRRLARLRARVVAVHGESQKRHKQGDGGFSLRMLSSGIMQLVSQLAPISAAERAKLRDLIIKSGFHRPEALLTFMLIKFSATLSSGILLGYLTWAGQWLGEYTSFLTSLLAGLGGAIVGGVLPEMGLNLIGNRRQRRLSTALPDALDLMTLCLESGLTFERTLSRVVQELAPMSPDLAREFSLAEAEMRLGAERKNVLNDLHLRTGVEGLRDLSTTIAQGERYGTPLAQSIKNIAEVERQQRAARIATQVERLPVLMSLPMLLLVTPGTLLLVAGPTFVSTMEMLGSIGK